MVAFPGPVILNTSFTASTSQRPGASGLTKLNQTGGVGKMVTAANVSASSPPPAAAPWPSTATPMLAIGQDARRDG
jgi:hypothetical protein